MATESNLDNNDPALRGGMTIDEEVDLAAAKPNALFSSTDEITTTPETGSSSSSGVISLTKKAKSESKSAVWRYFEKDSNVAARCTLCNTVCKHSGNTTNLRQHLKGKHALFCSAAIDQNKKRNASSDSCDESADDRETRKPKRQKNIQQAKLTRIDEAFERTSSFAEGGKNSDKITNAVLYMIAVDKMPLSTVENEGFGLLMQTVVPLYKLPSRRTITKLLDSRYEVLKEGFVVTLQTATSYSLTCDNWTDVGNQSYLGVSIHYVTEKNEMKNGCIGVFPMTGSHTSEYLTECLDEVIETFKLDKSKITVVVTDSAANIKKAVRDFVGRDKHLACFAHTMSHLVPDVLAMMPDARDMIAKAKAIVTLTKRSVVASDELKRLQIRDGKTEATALKFIQDVPTRWNSTLYMLQRFIELQDYVYAVISKCPNAPDMLRREEMQTLKDLVSLMEPVEKVIREVSGDSYPTCSSIIPLVHCLEMAVQNCKPSTASGNEFKAKLRDAIGRRFKDFELNEILAVSNVLDPRFKKLHFTSALAASNAISRISEFLKENTEEVTVTAQSVKGNNNAENSLWGFHDHLVATKADASAHTEGVSFELRQYLSQPVIVRGSDPLKYWSSMKLAFPALHKVAIKYVSIVGTSVSSERLFSQAGDIKTDNRSRLSGERLNKLLFLSSLARKDWGFA